MAINYTTGIAFEFGTVSNTSIPLGTLGFSKVDIDRSSRMILTVNTNTISYRYDNTGGTVTATAGHLGSVGQIIEILTNANIENFRMIRAGGSDATVAITLELSP